MRRWDVVSLVVCGTGLVLMPQIHHAVVAANVLYARAIAARMGEELGVEGMGAPGWMSVVSVGVGIGMIGVGVVGGRREGGRIDNATRPMPARSNAHLPMARSSTVWLLRRVGGGTWRSSIALSTQRYSSPSYQQLTCSLILLESLCLLPCERDPVVLSVALCWPGRSWPPPLVHSHY